MSLRVSLMRMAHEVPPEVNTRDYEYVMHPIALTMLIDELGDAQWPFDGTGRIMFNGYPIRKDADRNPEHVEFRPKQPS